MLTESEISTFKTETNIDIDISSAIEIEPDIILPTVTSR